MAASSSSTQAKDTGNGRGALFSRLSTDGSLCLFGEFSGQGRPWLSSLRELDAWAQSAQHQPMQQLIQQSLQVVQEMSQDEEAQAVGVFRQGFDVRSWIDQPEQAPAEAYLSAAPVSYCMIYLVEILLYQQFCSLLHKPVNEVASYFKGGGLTGHSQGVVCAVVVALSKNDAHFQSTALAFLKYMFWHGVRVQQVYPSKTLPAKVLRDAPSPPTPMLSVTGLPYTVLSKFIEKTNSTFGANSPTKKLYLSLINGLDACMVTGHPYSLVNLQSLLKTIQADAQENQDRIPFSKRKMKFHMGFTNVSVPFHCPLLEPAVALILEDLRSNAYLKDDNLLSITEAQFHGIPVWTTHDNTALVGTPAKSLMHSLVAMQCSLPVQWGLTCRKMISELGVSHVVDFSRGGASNSLGRMTQRNLDGTGIQILLAATEDSDDATVTTVTQADGSTKTVGDAMNTMNIKGRAAWLDLPLEGGLESFPAGTNWREQFGPKLLAMKDGSFALKTKYTDLFNRPPLFVSGMTPCTAEEVLCSAVINAGYTVELAGGGQHTPALFRQRIAGISANTKPGEGIHVNLLYLNPFLWNMQFPLCLDLKKNEGFNIECITIAAGVPGLDKCAEICEQMSAVGITKLGFKPGTAGAIASVVAIAHANPKMHIVLQWTGGRSGGHHSMEDSHYPLLQTYGLIRTAPNIILVFGGGIGDAASSLPYLSGAWSLPHFKPPMPVDGLLYGSRLMVALEAPTDPAVKALIVQTPGVTNEKEWEQSLTGVAGGVVTIQSELGEPIHKIATRGVMLWRELDEKFFSIANKDALRAALLKNKSYIINRLNNDFQKPYFGRKKDGLVVDLPQMTYEEVSLRLLDFFHPNVPAPAAASASAGGHAASSGWIDITYFWKFRTWILQVVSRFSGGSAADGAAGANTQFGAAEHEQLFKLLQFDQPVSALMSFMSKSFPGAARELLSPDDEDFFLLAVCMQPGKPVNFIPEIDETLKLWFKKDSLWFSEDLRSIPNQDVQRCAVLQSPVSTRFSLRANESVKSIMDGIHQGLVASLKAEAEAAAAAGEGEVEKQLLEHEVAAEEQWTEEMRALKAQFAAAPVSASAASSASASAGAAALSLTIPAGFDVSTINRSTWNDLWAASGQFWTRSLFLSEVILRNKKHALNYLAQLLAPRAGTTVTLKDKSIAVFDEAVLGRGAGPVVECTYDAAARSITVRIANPSSLSLSKVAPAAAPATVALTLVYTLFDSTFQYRNFGLLLEQSWDSKVAAIVEFYRSLWLGPAFAVSAEEQKSGAHVITAAEVSRFISATTDDTTHETPDGRAQLVPLDYSIVLGWTAIVTALIKSAEQIRGDLLALVHLSNEYRMPDESASPLAVGDSVRTAAEVTGVWIEPEGQVITISAKIYRAAAAADAPCAVEVISRFAIRPSTGAVPLPASDPAWFRRSSHVYRFAHLAPNGAAGQLNQLEVATLLSKKWHDLTAAKLATAMAVPTARTYSALELRFDILETTSKLETTGSITLGSQVLGAISSKLASPAPLSCPVLAFSKRKCTAASATPALVFDSPQSYPSASLRAPLSNKAYAIASKDVNVIHLNPYMIPLASLPTTITHGMYSSAKMRQAIALASGAAGVLHGRARIVNFKAEFRGMVLPGTQLRSSVTLRSMQDGLKQIEGELRDVSTDLLVLKATASVQQCPVAYLFTGQGSAQVNMGMELYGSSVHARAVWDAAESYMWSTYGVSMLHIVKQNPKSLRVNFAKNKDGEDMKARYVALGLIKKPTATASSGSASSSSSAAAATLSPADLAAIDSYTFQSSEGLLYATQFQQPAILLQESAAFADLKHRGVIARTAKLAGHSLGEYSMLAACLEGVPVSSLAEVVFKRGLTMQNAVERDSMNRSRFGMVAASPDRVGAFFTETHLAALVLALETETKDLLQIVNFNVYGAQYVIAGGLVGLEALRVALDAIAKEGKKLEGSDLARVVLDSAAAAKAKLAQTRDGFLPLTRGKASIPLTGIDVPFHSKQLMGGVASFRAVLQATFATGPATATSAGGFRMKAEEVVDKYVPNVLGLPFKLDKAYLGLISAATGSEIVAQLLADYDNAAKNPDEMARLLIIELLSYQFASPVQWIKTQDSLLRSGVQRFIEIGPQPTLVPMMKRSTMDVGLEYLWIGNELSNVCYMEEGVVEEGEAPAAKPAAAAPAAAAPAPAAAVAPVAAAAPAPVASAPRTGAAVSIPLSALHAIRLLISAKLKLSFADVDPAKSLKLLAGGKSAVQNEVLGDIANEFKAEPEGAAETPLQDLAAKVAGGYAGPGKVLAAMSAKNLGLLLPGGWGKSRAVTWLASEFGLDAPSADGVLAHALVHRVDKRLESDAAAAAWLAQVAHSYAKENNQSLSAAAPAAAGGAAGGAGALAAAVDPKELENLKALFRDQMDTLQAYLKGSGAGAALLSKLDSAVDGAVDREWLAHAEAELDIKFLAGVAPMFDKRKIRTYDASWAWAKTDVLRLGLMQPSTGKLSSLSAEQLYLLRNRATPEVLAMLQSNPEVAQAIAPFVQRSSVYHETRLPQRTHTRVSQQGKLTLHHTPRYEAASGASAFDAYVNDVTGAANPRRLVLSHGTNRSQKCDDVLRATMTALAHDGSSFSGKTALLTGCGAGSIGLEVARCLLLGGANVIVTTSTATRARMEMFRQWYRQWGGKGARLTVIPFNGASRQDCEALIAEVGVPDLLLPFAAISENGRDIGLIDGLAELAHRTMLTNVIRLVGAIKNSQSVANPNRYCHVLLPLSPNHGLFGHDGLYAESKIGLETLYWKWSSEGWSGRVGIVGAEIGWTKGTGLMSSNDLVAERMETQAGLRTFDATEMAFNICALLGDAIVNLARSQPLHADLSGGFAINGSGGLPAGTIRAALQLEADIQRAIYTDALLDSQQSGVPLPSASGPAAAPAKTYPLQPRAHLALSFPPLPAASAKGAALEGMLDLSKVAVIVGFGEVGPWGSSATRWEKELREEFSAEGAIQLARSMNLIRYFKGKHPATNRDHIGWVDVASNTPLADTEIAAKYAKHFAQHCGIRPINPALFKGYEPARKLFLQQLSLSVEMKPFEVGSVAEAEHLARFHGTKLALDHTPDGKILARMQPGATLYVPKAVVFDRQVAGQLPTGWDAARWGVPKDILNAVDPCTAYALAATMDALASAGLTDPYELYSKVHVSEVGNSIGSGMGGMVSLQGIFRQRLLDAQGLASDQLQESFINTTAAWVNMLLLSACGPITTPVAACATAAVSLELGVSALRSGKAKVMFVGGTEDFGEEGSYEFAQMGATSNSINEAAAGREPSEACRPCTSTRNGFMEAQGAGVQILTTAALAIEMGLPVYAIVAGVSTATDRQGRSIPAPGVGILSTARESAAEKPSPLLNLAYRRRQMERECAAIDAWLESELALDDADVEFLHAESERRLNSARRLHGNDFYVEQPSIAPLRGALAVWGLTIDDLEAVSFHGTSTVANEKNESNVVQMQMEHLGRSSAKPLPVICQKWMTGHPKGSAFAWMLNGLMQSMNSGLVPGNRNLDNPDVYLRKFDRLLLTDSTFSPHGRALRAAYGHSFGFGQAGAEVVVVHADSLWSAVPTQEFATYSSKRAERHSNANRHWLEWIMDKRPLIAVKASAPYSDADMHATFLSPLARATRVDETGAYAILQSSGVKKAGGLSFGGDKSKLNLALKHLSKSISWRNLRASPSHSSFLHVDSRGELLSASPSLQSPDSSRVSSRSDGVGRVGTSSNGSMHRSESVVWTAGADKPSTNQNLNTEVPTASNSNSFGGSMSRNASEAALNSIGMTHSLSGVNLTSASQEVDSECGVGVDVEEIASFENKDAAFLSRNFTTNEIKYCQSAANPAASFAGKWAAKEAVLKALSSLYSTTSNALSSGLSSAAAPMVDIEVMAPSAAAAGSSTSSSASLAPQVTLKGQAEKLAQHLNLASIQLSISHAGSHALSLAMARSRSSLQPIRSVADLSSLLASGQQKKK